jgi:hypothetical protein
LHPVITAGSSDAVFELVGQSVGPLSGGGYDCSAVSGVWSFVDAVTGERRDVPIRRLRLIWVGRVPEGGPESCVTSGDASQAPQAVLPDAFRDGLPHTINVSVELRVPALREVEDVNRPQPYFHSYYAFAVADGATTVRVTPPGAAPPPLPVISSPAPPVSVSFGAPATYPLVEHGAGLAVADLHLNGSGRSDGRSDVAVVETPDSASVPGRLEVWRAAPDGSLTASRGPYELPAGAGAAQTLSGDFGDHGRPDLAVAESGASAVAVLANQGDGTFDVPGTANLVGSRPVALAEGELCGSTASDLVAANSFTNDVTVLCNDGTGRFQGGGGHFFGGGGAQPSAVAIADLNRDRRDDVIVANGDVSGSVAVLRSTSAADPPTFAAPEYVASYSASGPTGLAVGDLNSDGAPDLVLADPGVDKVIVLLNTTGRGASTFSFLTSSVPTAGSRPAAVALGDFNGDRIVDIATANAGSANASVLLGDGSGDFSAPVLVGAGVNPHAVAAGDLNSDGRDDLIVANYGATSGSLTVALSLPPMPSGARDRARQVRRTPSRALRAKVVLRASPPRSVSLRDDGSVVSFAGLSATGRIASRLLGGRAAIRGVPAAALDLLDVDFAAAGDAVRYFDPPVNPFILRGTMVWRSRHDRHLLACVLAGPVAGGSPSVQRFVLTGGTGPLARLRVTLQFPALPSGRAVGRRRVTALISSGPPHALSSRCRGLVRALPRR